MTDGSPSPDTRERIIAAAEELFRDIGFQKTTVADIARTLSMSPANVYRFFASKQDINEAVDRRMTGRKRARLEAIASEPGSARARMRRMLAEMHIMMAEFADADAKIQEMVAVAIAESWRVIHDHIRDIDTIITRLVREGLEAGEFRGVDPEVAGPCVRAAMTRFCHPSVLVMCRDIPQPTLDELIDFILAALGAERQEASHPACETVRAS